MEQNVIIDFSRFPFCFRTTKSGDFTNKLKDEAEFFANFQNLFEVLIPHVSKNTFSNLKSEHNHCHNIEKDETDKIDLIYKITGELVKQIIPGIDVSLFLKQNLDGEVIWQLGNRGLRIIGIRQSNTFYVLFIDYHHLIYPSEKYNDKNYSKYSFGVIG